MKVFYTASAISFLTLLPSLALAAPTLKQGSSKTFYLITCTEGTGKNDNYDAIAYYTQPPQSLSESPEEVSQVSKPRGTWEGIERKAEFEDDAIFTAKIDKNAGSLKVGEIAGEGSLDGEPFVCFKSSGVLTSEKPDTCNVLYWCPSIDVNKSEKLARK